MKASSFAWGGAAALAVVFLATAVSVGTAQYAFGLFIGPLVETFGWSRTTVSASASFAAVGGLAAPLLGRALDVYGARPVLLGSLTVMGFGFFLRPWMTELWHWYTLSFMQFICFAGAASLPAAKLAAAWFPQSKGKALGFASMGNNFGGLTIPLSVTAIMAMASWREAFVALGFVCFALGIIAWFVVRDGPAPRPSGAQSATGQDLPSAALTGVTASEALRTSRFYLILAAVTLGYFTYATILTHMLAHLLTRGFTPTSASVALSTLAIGGLAGKVAFGMLSDRYGARRATIVNLLGQAMFTAIVALVGSILGLRIAMPLLGVFLGGFGIVSTLLVQECFGTRFFGSIMGLMSAGTVVAFGFGPLLAGLSYDLTGSYTNAYLIVAGFFVVGAVLLFTPPLRSGVNKA